MAVPSLAPPVRKSADRRRVLDPSLGPKRIQAACDLERRALPDIAVEDFAIIADQLDDAVDPVLGQSELLAEISLSPKQTFYFRILGFHLLFNIFLIDVQLLGIKHREMHPFDDVEPLVVALAHERPQRLLGNDLRQYDVVISFRELEPRAVESRCV